MIRGEVIGGPAVVDRLQQLPGGLRDAMRRGMGRAVLLVQTRSKEDKLSGQVLKVRTGRLRRSITSRIADDGDDKVVGTVGTNVEYARVHEYGFQGLVTVREHLRRTKSGGTATVRTHPARMNLPERSFLRSALAELQPEIREEFEQAVQQALQR